MLLAAMALQAGSSYANKRADTAIRAKQDQVAQAERIRQAAYQKQAQATLDKTMSSFDRPAQDKALADTTAQRDTAIQATQAQPGDYTPTTGANEPAVVHSDLAQQFADVLRRGKSETMARAKLGAYGGVQNDNSINLGRSGQDINQMADFSRGSAGVMPYEMNAAQNAGRKWGQIADLFKMGGYGLALYSMAQKPPLNYETSPSMTANVKSSLEDQFPAGATYTDPNDLEQAKKFGLIR